MIDQSFDSKADPLRPVDDLVLRSADTARQVQGAVKTQSVFDMVSLSQFGDAMEEACRSRKLTLEQAITYRRAKRNPRVMKRLYSRVMAEVPMNVYGGEGGFDWQAFLDWLIKNLPSILSLLLLFL